MGSGEPGGLAGQCVQAWVAGTTEERPVPVLATTPPRSRVIQLHRNQKHLSAASDARGSPLRPLAGLAAEQRKDNGHQKSVVMGMATGAQGAAPTAKRAK